MRAGLRWQGQLGTVNNGKSSKGLTVVSSPAALVSFPEAQKTVHLLAVREMLPCIGQAKDGPPLEAFWVVEMSLNDSVDLLEVPVGW